MSRALRKKQATIIAYRYTRDSKRSTRPRLFSSLLNTRQFVFEIKDHGVQFRDLGNELALQLVMFAQGVCLSCELVHGNADGPGGKLDISCDNLLLAIERAIVLFYVGGKTRGHIVQDALLMFVLRVLLFYQPESCRQVFAEFA